MGGQKQHHILSFGRKNSGAFEHSIRLAENLKQRGFEVRYYAHWFKESIDEMDVSTGKIAPIEANLFEKQKGIFHLQTHTWEHDGFLRRISQNNGSAIVYYLHAIIPYFYMNEKEKELFLQSQLPSQTLNQIIENRLSKRERTQLSAIEKSDYLLTLCETHKEVLRKLGVRKQIEVFENVSDFENIGEALLRDAQNDAKKLREKLQKTNVLIYCGNLYQRKGSRALLNSFAQIRENYPSSVLILLGVDEKKKRELLAKNELKEEISDDILSVPWIDKNSKQGKRKFLTYYLASDVLIQPIITERLYSRAVLDAMSLKIPTITCKSPYTLGSSENSEAVFNSFCYLIDNPETVKEIVDSAKEKVRRENTWDSYISRLEKTLLF